MGIVLFLSHVRSRDSELLITHGVNFLALRDDIGCSWGHYILEHLLLHPPSGKAVILLGSLRCLLEFFLPLADLVFFAFGHLLFWGHCHRTGISNR